MGRGTGEGHGWRLRPPLAPTSLWFLVQVDLVAVEIFEEDPPSPGFALGFAMEHHAPLLHPAVLAKTVVGPQPQQREAAGLVADDRQILLRPRQAQYQARLA